MYEAYVRKILQDYCNKKNILIATRLINFYFEAQKIIKEHHFELLNIIELVSEYSFITPYKLINGTGTEIKRARSLYVIHAKSKSIYSNKEIGDLINMSHSQVSNKYSLYVSRGDQIKEYTKFKKWIDE